MQITLTIDATPALLSALGQLAFLPSGSMASVPTSQATTPTDAAAFHTKSVSGCQTEDVETVTPFDGTDLSIEEIRNKAAQINSAGFGQEIRELLIKQGVSTISALPESNFAAFYEALAALDTANTQHVAGDDIRYE